MGTVDWKEAFEGVHESGRSSFPQMALRVLENPSLLNCNTERASWNATAERQYASGRSLGGRAKAKPLSTTTH